MSEAGETRAAASVLETCPHQPLFRPLFFPFPPFSFPKGCYKRKREQSMVMSLPLGTVIHAATKLRKELHKFTAHFQQCMENQVQNTKTRINIMSTLNHRRGERFGIF